MVQAAWNGPCPCPSVGAGHAGTGPFATLFVSDPAAWSRQKAGAVQIVHAFQVRTWSGFFVYLLDGIIRAAVGTLMVMNPTSGAQALTLLLSFYFIVAGVFRTIASVILQFPSWGWSVASGLLSVVLGVMLAMQYPTSSQWFIGFAVGLDLILYGWALLMFAAAVKTQVPSRS